MSIISLSQAFAQWQELAADIPRDDGPMLAESWNNYTDSLAKDGQLCALQYQYAPAYDEDMPGFGRRFDELADDRDFIVEKLGVTLEAEFVPFSQSRNKAEKDPSLNWRVTVKKDGREVITTDYMQGCAHCPAYRAPSLFVSGKRDEWKTRQRIKDECETGRAHTSLTNNGSYIGKPGKRIDAPDVVDVLNSLLLDSAALDSGDFSDWCDEYGYDSDSIKARAMYDACIQTAIKLRGAFGEKTLSELRDLFADM